MITLSFLFSLIAYLATPLFSISEVEELAPFLRESVEVVEVIGKGVGMVEKSLGAGIDLNKLETLHEPSPYLKTCKNGKKIRIPKTGGSKINKAMEDLSTLRPRAFNSYLKQLETMYKRKEIKALTQEQADFLVELVKKFNLPARYDKPHMSHDIWNVTHLNIGKGEWHVPYTPKK